MTITNMFNSTSNSHTVSLSVFPLPKATFLSLWNSNDIQATRARAAGTLSLVVSPGATALFWISSSLRTVRLPNRRSKLLQC